MMNRGVMQRPMFSRGVQGLAMGGPPMDPGMMPPPPMDPGMMPPPPMGPGMMPPPPMDPGMMPPPPIDPAMEQQLLGAESTGQEAGMQLASDMMTNLDGAEDYQTLIDGIRGNQLPLEARYQELAGLVGENDAMATPESVLALTQPTIMMTEQGAMDSGIGELMQGISGSVDMSGPMEEGVGSLMMAGAGNTPPVNFRQGGPVEVRRFSNGTPPGGNSSVITDAQAMAPDYQKYFEGAMDSEARSAALEEQNKMAKAQMLFDIAGTALNFAGQTEGNTIAERLANSASQTQLTDKIGARSAGMLTAKQAQLAEDRQMRMAGLQAALAQSQTDEAADRALEVAKAKVKPGDAKYQRLVGPNGKKLGTFNVATAKGVADLEAAIKDNPDASLYNIGTEPADSRKSDLKIVVSKSGEEQTFDLSTAEGRKNFKSASEKDGAKVYNVSAAPSDTGFKTITLYDPLNPTVAITKPTNTVEERQAVSLLLAAGYADDDKRAAASIAEEFKIKQEDRALATLIALEARNLETTVAAEKRLLDANISGEDRAVLTLIAREGRAKTRVIDAEARLKETTLGSEERALATKEAQEARNELAAIARDSIDLKTQIAAEKRKLETTIGAEARALVTKTDAEARNLITTVAAEKRLLDTNINAEERKVLTLIAKEGRAKTRVIDTEARLKATTLGSEDRALATKEAQEARDELAAIRREGRDLQTQIAREKRNLETTIGAETRAQGFRVAAEARLLDTTIGAETRNVLRLIAREARAEETAIRQEARASDTTLSAEDRAEARLLAKEARNELTTILAEGRSLKAQIDKEKRNLATTINAEDRATARETVVYGRNRADELKDIDAQVASTIATEERALGRTLNAEERAQITWQARNTVTTKNDTERLRIAQGLRDASQMATEDRKAIVDQNNFVRDQTAKIAGETRAVANRDTIELREVNGELVRVDTLTGETTVLFGEPTIPDPSMAQVTLKNADGVPVTTVIDVNSPQGKAVLAQVNAANAAAPGSASYQKVPTASTTIRGFLVPGEGVFTSYDGKTYVDEAGNAKPLPGGAFEVSSTIAYEVAKNEKMAVGAQAQLDALDIQLVQGMTKIDGSPISRADMAEVKDAFAASRKGTGFWSKVYAGLDAVAGGLAPEAFGELFKDTTDARQFVKMVRVMGRSALASSPRFAVMDLKTVEQLFPNEETLFANPKTEARKLNDIVGYLTEEKVRILDLFANRSPMDSTMKSTLNQKLFEINRLESILGPVAMLGQASVNQEAIDRAKASMRLKKGG